MSAVAGRTAVVAGGGIGGLATALALQRSGWQVTVRERSLGLDRGGAGLVLWPNALRCLAALGVDDAVRARATPMTGSAILRADGRRLSTIGPDPRSADRPLGMVRADLVEALAASLGPGVLRFGDEVRDHTTLDADLVVGADGLRSAVRRSLDSTVEPEHRGYTVWRALIPLSVESWGGRAELCETWGGDGLRFGMVPAGPTSTYVYAAAPSPAGQSSTDELPGLRQRFGHWHEPVPALLAAMESVQVLRHDIYDLPPGRTPLHRGRRVLVGDAAHAMEPNLGQGAGLALEDAVVLDHALASESSVEAALLAYSTRRRPRVVALARQSRRVGQVVRLKRPSALALRDIAMRATPDRLARRGTSAAVDWRPPLSAHPEHQEAR
ncbi:FAD-dependent monooxygenase [Nocardioides sp.]|uniref:FAD-dependent monooxygenase n=1 Tax=Nocardioides sp. TaxID=35761 RepID=UPI002C1863C0|nr:FAD-dependent monooxygenase [Nocardioides sp.]HXH80696.1 FAD-dependent monooxygenase [Nocardioides sp.]